MKISLSLNVAILQASDDLIHVFSNEWFVSEKELHASNLQYMLGEDPILI